MVAGPGRARRRAAYFSGSLFGSLNSHRGVTANPPRAGDRSLSPAGSRVPVETPSQRVLAAAHEERGVVIVVFAGSVSMKFGE